MRGREGQKRMGGGRINQNQITRFSQRLRLGRNFFSQIQHLPKDIAKSAKDYCSSKMEYIGTYVLCPCFCLIYTVFFKKNICNYLMTHSVLSFQAYKSLLLLLQHSTVEYGYLHQTNLSLKISQTDSYLAISLILTKVLLLIFAMTKVVQISVFHCTIRVYYTLATAALSTVDDLNRCSIVDSRGVETD